MSILNQSQEERDEELAYLTNKPVEVIKKIKIATPDSIRVYDEKEPELKADQYINLYKQYKYLNMLAYIKTLMKTSAKNRHPELFQLLKNTNNKVCLDYGSGVGTHAIALAENDNEVTLYDVEGSELHHFACHRMLGRKLQFDVLVHTDVLPMAKYDVIICTDVLEHVEDPLHEIKRMELALKPDGILHLMVSTMIKPSSGHFPDSIEKWKTKGVQYMNTHFIKEGQTIYRKK